MDNKGIKTVSDLIDDEGKFKTIGELNTHYNLNINFMLHNSIKSAIPSSWIKRLKPIHITKYKKHSYDIILNINDSLKDLVDIKCKHFYQVLIRRKIEVVTACARWEAQFPNYDFNWRSIFKLPYTVARETYLQSFHFKLVNRYLACRVNLHKWNRAPNPLCGTCSKLDTIEHFLYECTGLKFFWRSLFGWLQDVLNTHITLTVPEILFGLENDNEDNILHVNNYCMLAAKCYVYNCKVNDDNVIFSVYHRRLMNRLQIERCIAISNSKLIEFLNCWDIVLNHH